MSEDKSIAEMIDVMRRSTDSNAIVQYRLKYTISKWADCDDPHWNWDQHDYRVKQKDGTLCPDDFPPGTILRGIGWRRWVAVSGVDEKGVSTNCGYHPYKNLELAWERSLDGGKTWLPCSK